jgi:hypothetical protein
VLWALDDERDDQQLVIRYPYFETETPLAWDGEHTYVDGPPLKNTRNYDWNHGIGEIVTALIAAGLRIDFLHEHREIPWMALPWMESAGATVEASRYTARQAWRLPEDQRDRLPLMYSIKATRA